MIRPFIYATADANYNELYAPAFLASARAHGHEAAVFHDDLTPDRIDFKARSRYGAWRYVMLPEMLAAHPAVLILDVDSIIQGPIEIEDEYDLGIFVRPWKQSPKTKALAGMFYCTRKALEFAQALADGLSTPDHYWTRDQKVLWHTYEALGSKFRVNVFNNSHINWTPNCNALVWTAKGPAKAMPAFIEAVKHWSGHADYIHIP